jgi:hypothetical protein
MKSRLSNNRKKRDVSTTFLKHHELSDPTCRETSARELVDESKPVCFCSHVADVTIAIFAQLDLLFQNPGRQVAGTVLKRRIDIGDPAEEDITPLHPANIRSVPYPDARVKLVNMPKEHSNLNNLCATVLGIASSKSFSGATKVPLLVPPFIIFLFPPIMQPNRV